ncbi:hypothetical protein BK131_20380 [Paenibacillus amylolyticus]|uniref:Uncharacterized protein n=1 Tax=Paenibacillus amylolyticus TaxID=1451 RepID=A0A1R1BPK7_PAEAM|nr:hypothetical protein [Paenibacillus amylolyticus]OMF11830.1 hypothetical protein BK131_20380 [Paenibacillus amylolyticus]
MNNIIKKTFSGILALILLFNVIGLSSASANNEESTYQYSGSEFAELEKTLYLIEAIPDEVVEKGAQATAKWLSSYTGDKYITDGDKFYNLSKEDVISTMGVVGCTSAVGLAIAENLFAFAKIAKIKDVIKAGGGVTKFIGNLVPAFKVAKNEWGYSASSAIGYAVKFAAKDAGPELISAAIGFFSIGDIYSSCFE